MTSSSTPALANLWNWGHYALVVWAMSAGMVLFSAHHVLRLWRAWVFTLCCVPAMPFLLLTAQLGGCRYSRVRARPAALDFSASYRGRALALLVPLLRSLAVS